MHLVIFGYGYTGTAMALAASKAGMQVSIVTRTPKPPPRNGIAVVPYDTSIKTATHLLVTAPPTVEGDPVLLRSGPLIGELSHLQWIGYLSTTGVYGNQDGGWVDEASTPSPLSERGWRRIEAEHAWAVARPGLAIDCFRLAGIYGPGRSILADLRSGRARRVIKPGHLFGRIHREDIVGALLAAMMQARPGGVRVLNGSDDEPAASADVIAEGASLLNLPLPPAVPFEDAAATMSEMALSFWADNRKVRSVQTQAWLGRRWLYPTYREGLRAILATEQGKQVIPD